MATGFSQDLIACPHCHQVQRGEAGRALRCCRCHAPLKPVHRYAVQRSLAWASTGLILYLPAITLPIMSIEKLGFRHEAGVLSGALGLMTHGEFVIGLLVLVVSVVVPLGKLLGLFVLASGARQWSLPLRLKLFHLVEMIGRWGMLDVLLVAVLVAAVKLGDLVHVSAGPGAIVFMALVIANVVASLTFDPRILWERAHGT